MRSERLQSMLGQILQVEKIVKGEIKYFNAQLELKSRKSKEVDSLILENISKISLMIVKVESLKSLINSKAEDSVIDLRMIELKDSIKKNIGKHGIYSNLEDPNRMKLINLMDAIKVPDSPEPSISPSKAPTEGYDSDSTDSNYNLSDYDSEDENEDEDDSPDPSFLVSDAGKRLYEYSPESSCPPSPLSESLNEPTVNGAKRFKPS